MCTFIATALLVMLQSNLFLERRNVNWYHIQLKLNNDTINVIVQ